MFSCSSVGVAAAPQATEAEMMRSRVSSARTRIQPEKARGAAEILPGERRIFLEVVNEYFIQSLGHKGAVENIRIYRKRGWHSTWWTDVCRCVCKGRRCSCATSVVHIRGDLDVAQQCVDWQIVEVLIFFQRKFPSQRHLIPICTHRVDQQRIEVVKLGRTQARRGDCSSVTMLEHWHKSWPGWLSHIDTHLQSVIVVVVKISVFSCFCQLLTKTQPRWYTLK